MKPVILFFFANDIEDKSQYLRKLAAESNAIEKALSGAAEMCEFYIRKNTTGDDIRRSLAQYRHRVTIFHYAGHASSLQLMLETETGQKEAFLAETLAAYLEDQDNLELVFLNGCSTDAQVEMLLDVGIPHVISTNQAIEDSAATRLAGVFYEQIASGATIDGAWRVSVAATKQHAGNSLRSLYIPEAVDKVPALQNQFPWSLGSRPGINPVSGWNLPDASQNPLLGLPDVPSDIGYPDEPFLRLRRFTRNEARIFFGRGSTTRSLYHAVIGDHGPPAPTPIILLYGQSGVGKSSLLEAGLLPRLEGNTDTRFKVIYVRRTERGIANDFCAAMGMSDQNSDSELDLRQAWKNKESTGESVIVILDQVEEAFSQQSEDEGEAEIASLAKRLRSVFQDNRMRPKGKIILAFRKEWYPNIDNALKAEKVSRQNVFLKRLSREGVLEAIKLSETVRNHYHLTFENETLPDDMATKLIEDQDSPLAPTLQILMSAIWEQATEVSPSEPVVTDDLYQGLKSIQLGKFLDQQLAEIGKLNPAAYKSGALLALLGYHCSALGTATQRSESDRNAHFGNSHAAIEELVDLCRKKYLLTDNSSEQNTGTSTTRLVHDTLAPLVLKRINESPLIWQRAERILALRTQSAALSTESDTGTVEPNLLTRSELGVLQKASVFMRQLSPDEERLVKSSKQAVRKSLAQLASLVAGLLLIVVASWFWFQGQSRQTEIARRMDLIFNASSRTIHELKDDFKSQESLTAQAIKLAMAEVPTEAERNEIQLRHRQVNVPLLEAYLGAPDFESIFESLTVAEPDDLISFSLALRDLDAKGVESFKAKLNEQNSSAEPSETVDGKVISMRARLTWLGLMQGDAQIEIPPQWYVPSADNGPRTQLIIALANWFKAEPEYLQAFKKAETKPHLLAVMCQSIYFLPDSVLTDSTRSTLVDSIEGFLQHDYITVRSSTLAALNRLGDVPRLDKLKTSGKDWFAIKDGSGNTLDFALVDDGSGHSFWMATTEMPSQIFEKCLSIDSRNRMIKKLNSNYASDGGLSGLIGSNADERAIDEPAIVEPDGDEASERWAEMTARYKPAQFLILSDALECCNSLNQLPGSLKGDVNKKSYSFKTTEDEDKKTTTTWTFNKTRGGFRLPLAAEWKLAAAAKSTKTYSFGDDSQFLGFFGCTSESSNNEVDSILDQLPNAFGFFGMHGNVREWCWGSDDSGSFQALSEHVEGTKIKTKDGNYSQDKFEVGLDHQGTNVSSSKRDFYMGFRPAITNRPD